MVLERPSFARAFTGDEIDLLRRWEVDMALEGLRKSTIHIRLKDIKIIRKYLQKSLFDAREQDYFRAWKGILSAGYVPTSLARINDTLHKITTTTCTGFCGISVDVPGSQNRSDLISSAIHG